MDGPYRRLSLHRVFLACLLDGLRVARAGVGVPSKEPRDQRPPESSAIPLGPLGLNDTEVCKNRWPSTRFT